MRESRDDKAEVLSLGQSCLGGSAPQLANAEAAGACPAERVRKIPGHASAQNETKTKRILKPDRRHQMRRDSRKKTKHEKQHVCGRGHSQAHTHARTHARAHHRHTQGGRGGRQTDRETERQNIMCIKRTKEFRRRTFWVPGC